MNKRRGQPTLYTLKLAQEICDTIATTSKGITALCKENSHWPHSDTVYAWLKDHNDFSVMYAKAKRNQIDCLINEIIEIADNQGNDKYIDENGIEKVNNAAVNRARLRIDTRKWLACKLVPRVYGDKYIATTEAQSDELLNDCIDRKKLLDEQYKKAF
jgi:hypothetical protein